MAKPASRFKTVLNVKKHQEKAAQQQLMQIHDTHQREKGVLENLHAAKEVAIQQTPARGRARATDMQVHRAFIFKLSRQITNQSAKVEQIRTQEDAKRVELTERMQSRQMVEQLDERRRAEVMKEVDKKEQEMLDDLANRSKKDAV